MLIGSAMTTETKHLIDLASASVAIGSLLSFLPHIAALLTIIWTAIRIYESDTVQKLFRRKTDG